MSLNIKELEKVKKTKNNIFYLVYNFKGLTFATEIKREIGFQHLCWNPLFYYFLKTRIS